MVILIGQCGPNAHVSMNYYFWMVVEPWRRLWDHFCYFWRSLGGHTSLEINLLFLGEWLQSLEC
jgi:hypothetical protein